MWWLGNVLRTVCVWVTQLFWSVRLAGDLSLGFFTLWSAVCRMRWIRVMESEKGFLSEMSPRTSRSHHPDICSDSERHFCLDRSRISIPHHGPLGILLPVRPAPERLPRRVQAVCVFFRVRVPVHRALGGGGYFSPHSIFICRILQCYSLTSSRLLKGSKLLWHWIKRGKMNCLLTTYNNRVWSQGLVTLSIILIFLVCVLICNG